MITIIKYLVFFIAASLILPYLGFHILTNPPEPDESTTSKTNSTRSERPQGVIQQAPSGVVEPSLEDYDEAALAEKEDPLIREATQPKPGALSDIQELLGE